MAHEVNKAIYKFYPVAPSGEVDALTNQGLDSVDEILAYLDANPGSPMRWAQIPIYEFVDVPEP